MAVLSGFYELLLATPAIASLLAPVQSNTPYTGVYFSLAAKGAPLPYVVIHTLNAPPAEKTQDGSSALIDGEFQFDSYADADSGGQLATRKISQALRDLLKDWSGPLPDGTNIQFAEIILDLDDPYEVGGRGYLNRSVLRLKTQHTEPS
jgi:hypothetical protein